MASNGVVLYEGPSAIDGAPVVSVATGLSRPSANTKTGMMLQTWTMRADIPPFKAVHDGADFSVCGDCPARGCFDGQSCKRRFCYVNVAKGPEMVWKAWERGSYSRTTVDLAAVLARTPARVGAYGEPTATPVESWSPFLDTRRRTGYTHRWREAGPEWQALCMASVDTPEERTEARNLGWRTFRIRLPDEPVLPGEVVCPASEEAGHRKRCESCCLCNGGARGADVVIIAHGRMAEHYRRWRK